MEAMRFDKNDLMKIIEENREKHKAIFEEAIEGYRKQTIEVLENHVKRLEQGKTDDIMVSIPAPRNHTMDYDRILKMLEMSEDTVITMDENTFAQYVMDDWIWKRQFLTSTSAYSATAAQELARTQ